VNVLKVPPRGPMRCLLLSLTRLLGQLHDILRPTSSRTSFDDVYLVTDLMDTDLGQVPPSHAMLYVWWLTRVLCRQLLASGQLLGESHVQFFVYQILCGLAHIHSASVLHRDIKPGRSVLFKAYLRLF